MAMAGEATTPNTTFVQAEPSNFRAVVQKLTGASDDPSAQKLPLSVGSRQGQAVGPKRPNFKLQERRNGGGGKKLELSVERGMVMMMMMSPSPVSPLEMGLARTPHEDQEDRAIAQKGFYLHPSPLSTPRSPELLPLFPLHSPSSNPNNIS
ncbi:hypothetical protein Fmac_012616 [Flemingia macrophylla]|uniref:VQ domain-containing protein n=1 Tax=Flemingia macrophylla TaxID=520843 RepID=A0ABD1MQT8_9FABA